MAIRKQAAALRLKRRHKGVAKPKGEFWLEAENARLRAYAAGQLSYTELRAQLPGRTWDGIEHQARVLGLSLRQKPVYYHLVPDVREMVSEEDSSRRISQAYNLQSLFNLDQFAGLALRLLTASGSGRA
jgi:ribosomal protein L30/L7E